MVLDPDLATRARELIQWIGEAVKVFHIVGARPNFMKVAPVLNALKAHRHVVQTLVHTGQHYNANMSDVFLSSLAFRLRM